MLLTFHKWSKNLNSTFGKDKRTRKIKEEMGKKPLMIETCFLFPTQEDFQTPKWKEWYEGAQQGWSSFIFCEIYQKTVLTTESSSGDGWR